MLYHILKKICSIALHFFFRKWQVNGKENIPEGPVIFVPNHQNAFLDAVLVACSSEKNPWFMTRSDVFNNPQVKKILAKIKMLPVYRFRDGYKTLRQNEEVMRFCVDNINNGETLLIFAEGNHGERFQLRSLQKGVARIAFAVDPEKNISIVPVGIQYDLSRGFRSRVLVNFGKPIFVNEILQSNSNVRESHEILLEKTKNELTEILLHIPDEFYTEKFEYLKKYRNISSDLVKQLQNDQQTIENYPKEENQIKYTEKISIIRKLNNNYTRINLYISSLIINKLLLKNIKDPQFGNSVKFAAGLFITPAIWILQSFTIYWITGSKIMLACYLISLPVSLWNEKTL